MRRLLAATMLIAILLPTAGNADGPPDEWFGKVSYSESGFVIRTVCRYTPKMFFVCFSIGEVSGLSMDISVGMEEGFQGPKLSTETWPDVKVDGRQVYPPGSPRRTGEDRFDSISGEGGSWEIVLYDGTFGPFISDGWRGSKPTLNLLLDGKNMSVRLSMEDGTTREFEYPMEGLREILLALMPDCCRNPE